jgi:transposase
MLCAGIDAQQARPGPGPGSPPPRATRLPSHNTPGQAARHLLAALAHHRPHLVALEPTGASTSPSSSSWPRRASRWPWSTPDHLAAFRRATGERHKTDRQEPSSSPATPRSVGKASGLHPPAQSPPGAQALVGYREDLARGKGHPQPAGGGPLARHAEFIASCSSQGLACVVASPRARDARGPGPPPGPPQAEVLRACPVEVGRQSKAGSARRGGSQALALPGASFRARGWGQALERVGYLARWRPLR